MFYLIIRKGMMPCDFLDRGTVIPCHMGPYDADNLCVWIFLHERPDNVDIRVPEAPCGVHGSERGVIAELAETYLVGRYGVVGAAEKDDGIRIVEKAAALDEGGADSARLPVPDASSRTCFQHAQEEG